MQPPGALAIMVPCGLPVEREARWWGPCAGEESNMLLSSIARTALLGVLALSLTLLLSCSDSQEPQTEDPVDSARAQTVCPVMGGKINKELYIDVKGYRVYVCCEGCTDKIKADPDTYLAKIKANGETPEKAPAAKS